MDPKFKAKFIRITKKVIQVGDDISGVVCSLKDKPSLIQKYAIGVKTVNTLIDYFGDTVSEYFDKDWDEMSLAPLEDQIFDLLQKYNKLELVQEDQHYKVYIYSVDNLSIGFRQYAKDSPDTLIPTGQDETATKKSISKFLYSILGNTITLSTSSSRNNFLLETDVLSKCKSSGTADAIWRRTAKFIEKDYFRAILLHGVPGTGKSYIARYITQLAGGTSLRIPANLLGSIMGIAALLELVQPAVLIIDDFDRVGDQSGILDNFEQIKVSAKLFIVTVNNKERLDPATLRVGRFDDVIEIKSLDKEVLDYMFKDLNPKAQEILRTLPIAYIDEYKKIKEILGEDVAMEELAMLAKRAEDISVFYSDKRNVEQIEE